MILKGPAKSIPPIFECPLYYCSKRADDYAKHECLVHQAYDSFIISKGPSINYVRFFACFLTYLPIPVQFCPNIASNFIMQCLILVKLPTYPKIARHLWISPNLLNVQAYTKIHIILGRFLFDLSEPWGTLHLWKDYHTPYRQILTIK